MGFIAFFFEMLQSLFATGWAGTVLGIIILVVVIAIIVLILWGVFYALDSWFQPLKQAPGTIDGHDFVPAYIRVVPRVSSGGDTVLVPEHVPDSWSVSVRVGTRHAWMSCSKDCHDTYKNQQSIIATLKSGRLSGRMYVQAISPA